MAKRTMWGDSASPFVLVIATRGGAGGHFVVQGGEVRLFPGLHPSPDFTQVRSTGADAVRALGKADETEVLRCFEAGTLRMSGSFLHALWFNEAVKRSRAVLPWIRDAGAATRSHTPRRPP